MLTTLTALSPLDGRYRKQIEEIAAYFSEYGLMRYRVKVEIAYFLKLTEIPLPPLDDFPIEKKRLVEEISNVFSLDDAKKIKDIEKETNHDVKAVEYFIKEKFDQTGLGKFKEFIHFGLTSQDINNTAVPLLLKEASEVQIFPAIFELKEQIKHLAEDWMYVPMLARTHGQPASPTTVGKELQVFYERLQIQFAALEKIPFTGKFGGATGNFNAHQVAYPGLDWNNFANQLLLQLGLHRSFPTTQIEHYDQMAALFDNFKRVNTILIDFAMDIWQYIALNYFTQKIKAKEVGSSTMPHKVNPIDFENAEGNLKIANALFDHLSSKLPVSRLQRDLTDSTVLRNIGVPLGHTLIAIKSLLKGVNKLQLNEQEVKNDLTKHWVVVAEGIQTILRREGYPNPYEALKEFTRVNTSMNENTIKAFIDSLEVDETIKEELRSITPYNYTGIIKGF